MVMSEFSPSPDDPLAPPHFENPLPAGVSSQLAERPLFTELSLEPPIQVTPDYSLARSPPVAAANIRRVDAHKTSRLGKASRKGTGVAVVTWLLSVLAILLALQYFVPKIVEQSHYAAARGRQRAEHEAATDGLKSLPLKELSRAYQMVSQRVSPSVVHINVTGGDDSPDDSPAHFFGPHRPQAHGQGSGVIIDPAGYVLTNYHVVHDSSEIKVGLSDGRVVAGQVVGLDRPTDLAVIRIQADNLIAAEWGDSDDVQVGSLVWAVGSPFGLQRSITQGIVSAKDRAGMGSVFQEFLQTDAAVNPGNSGGPLVDENGRVIGINTAIVGQTYQGISFAIPSRLAREVYQRLRSDGHLTRGWLGIALDTVSEERAKQLGLPEAKGAYVQQVVDDLGSASPAKLAGMKVGDVVVLWNEKKIDSPTTLTRAVAQTKIGSTARVVVMRGGQELTLEVRVGLRPQELN